MIKVLNVLRSFLNQMDRLGNRTNWFIGLCLSEQQFWYFSLFMSVLGHLESELHSVCFFFGFMTM